MISFKRRTLLTYAYYLEKYNNKSKLNSLYSDILRFYE